jgi:hypothetical protein
MWRSSSATSLNVTRLTSSDSMWSSIAVSQESATASRREASPFWIVPQPPGC